MFGSNPDCTKTTCDHPNTTYKMVNHIRSNIYVKTSRIATHFKHVNYMLNHQVMCVLCKHTKYNLCEYMRY